MGEGRRKNNRPFVFFPNGGWQGMNGDENEHNRRKTMHKRKDRNKILTIAVILLAAFCLTEVNPASGQRSSSRRSQRVRMEQVQVASPDGEVKFTVLANAERLTSDLHGEAG